MHCRTWPGCDEFGLGEEGCRRNSRLWRFGWNILEVVVRTLKAVSDAFTHRRFGLKNWFVGFLMGSWSWWILFAFLGSSWSILDVNVDRFKPFCIVRTDRWQQASSPGTKACQSHSQAFWFGEEGNGPDRADIPETGVSNRSDTGVQQSLWVIPEFYQSQIWIFVDSQSILSRKPVKSTQTTSAFSQHFKAHWHSADTMTRWHMTPHDTSETAPTASWALVWQDDVRQFVVRREVKEGKKSKAPKIQRLITPQLLQRKRFFKAIIDESATNSKWWKSILIWINLR